MYFDYLELIYTLFEKKAIMYSQKQFDTESRFLASFAKYVMYKTRYDKLNRTLFLWFYIN